LPSEERHLQLKDFFALVNKSDSLHDSFGAKDIGPLFNLSMQTQIDEISSERHMKMYLVEFVEALTRVASRVILS